MRYSVFVALFVITCGSASGEEATKPSALLHNNPWIRQKACEGLGSLAATVMKQRQQEVPMSEMISRVQTIEGKGFNEGTFITSNLLIGIVSAAYKHPAFTSPERQNEMIAAFRNEIELPCFEGKLATSP